MLLDEQFDADEILRDFDERFEEEETTVEDEMCELDFENVNREHEHFRELASDLETTEDIWG